MTATLSNGTAVVAPWDRIGFTSTNQARAIVHDLLDGSVAVSLAPPRPRSGQLALAFLSSSAAETARQLLIQPAVWTVTDPVAAVNGLRFVVTGDIEAAQQDIRTRWMLTVAFQEVPA